MELPSDVIRHLEAVLSRGERVEIALEEPARAPTPGQLAVFYDGDVVVGSAWIERSAAAWS